MKTKMFSLALILFLLSISLRSVACSAFRLKNKTQLMMCKSYDWSFGEGVLIYNPRGVEKMSMPVGGSHERIKWISKYANLSFNQYGQTMANGGINEKGLAIEVLWLQSSKYAEVEGSKALNELQWIQYGLDNFESVEELIRKTAAIEIKPLYASVHYFISDASGNSAVVEYVAGKRILSTGEDMPYSAITNSTYSSSLNGLTTEAKGCSRFNRICSKINELPDNLSNEEAFNYGFESLDMVKSQERTQWQIVYDLKNQKIQFRTKENVFLRSIDLNDFDFNGQETLYVDLKTSGPLNPANFKRIGFLINNELLKNAFDKLQLPVPFFARWMIAVHLTTGETNRFIYKIVNAFDSAK
jgi:choloylglycine hydrolase